jgi:hypothetical protein
MKRILMLSLAAMLLAGSMPVSAGYWAPSWFYALMGHFHADPFVVNGQ